MMMKCKGDSPHVVIYEVELANDALLHRFDNPAGVPFSAIYVDGIEVWNCERSREANMVYDWNKKHDYTVERDVETVDYNNGYSIRRFTDEYGVRWSELRQNNDVRVKVPVEAEQSMIDYWNQVVHWIGENHVDNSMLSIFNEPLVVK